MCEFKFTDAQWAQVQPYVQVWRKTLPLSTDSGTGLTYLDVATDKTLRAFIENFITQKQGAEMLESPAPQGVPNRRNRIAKNKRRAMSLAWHLERAGLRYDPVATADEA